MFVRVERLAADAAARRTPTCCADEVERRHAAIDDRAEPITTPRATKSAKRCGASRSSADAMRAAMAKTRAARQNYDQTIQGVFADAASKMSAPAGIRLADWPPNRKPRATGQYSAIGSLYQSI